MQGAEPLDRRLNVILPEKSFFTAFGVLKRFYYDLFTNFYPSVVHTHGLRPQLKEFSLSNCSCSELWGIFSAR